eukprot:TRINITY_DN5749_c0_g1_i1.p1 TRINITY_DN5749_c0_g1~~TRINITY_DN5749_c0_g1_i1.p1  ORF type:complete len:288 (-),score=39.19 TRINITY_DN5749_c0_g1_i1:313-1176(-)
MELERLEAQVNEIEALQSVFSQEGEFVITPNQKGILTFAQKIISGQSSFDVQDVPSLSGKIVLLDIKLNNISVALRFDLPNSYPDTPPHLAVECSTDNATFQTLTQTVQETAQQWTGEECLLACVESLREKASEIMEKNLAEEEQQQHQQQLMISNSHSQREQISICLIWFHHIRNPNKKKNVQNWANELELGGYCKPGWPGVIIAEGYKQNVDEYIKRLRALSWQAMQVRAQEYSDIPLGDDIANRRKFRNGFKLLGDSDLSEVSSSCKEVGLEELFLTALKITKK